MKSKDIEADGLYFEVTEEGVPRRGNAHCVLMKILNKTDKFKVIKLPKPILISIKNETKQSAWCVPVEIEFSPGCRIDSKSFTTISIEFNNDVCDKFYDGDKLQLNINNVCNLYIERSESEWFFVGIEKRQIVRTLSPEDYLLETVECFESLEESIGISIQNVSINIKKNNIQSSVIDLFFEVLAIDDKCKETGFAIEYGIYDKNNKIRKFSNIKRYSGDFIGFEIFAFQNIELPMSLKDIGKIRIYPTKC